MLLEASIDTGMCHGVKCREMFARKSKMTKKEGWAFLEEKNGWIRQQKKNMRSANFLDTNRQIKSI